MSALKRIPYASTFLVAGLVFAVSIPTHAQIERPPGGTAPALGGHTFIPSAIIKQPFLNTYLRTALGFGKALNYSPNDLDDGALTFVLLSFEYQQRLVDWLSLLGNVELAGRLGTSAVSALSEGVTLATAFEIGGIARIAGNERTTLSGTLTLANSRATRLNLLDFVQDLIDSITSGGSIDSLRLIDDRNALQGRGGVRFAYGVSRKIGLATFAELSIGEKFADLGETNLGFEIGGSVDIDFGANGGVPVGIIGGAQFATFSQTASVTKNRLFQTVLGFAYTGRRDYSFGLEWTWSRVPLIDETTISAAALGMRMRYFF